MYHSKDEIKNRKMYNEETKNMFLLEYVKETETLSTYKIFLYNIGKAEEELGIDVAEMDESQLRYVLGKFKTVKMASYENNVVLLRNYIRWCNKKGVFPENTAIENITIDTSSISEQIRNMMVSNPKHLQICLNQIFAPEAELTADNVMRCYYWLSYAGLEEKDIFEITTDDVLLERQVVKFSGREYPIYREGVESIYNCKMLPYFSRSTDRYTKEEDRAPGNQLLRGIRKEAAAKYIRVVLSRKNKAAVDNHKTEIRLTHEKVRMSGIFYRLAETEKAGVPLDFTFLVDEAIKGKAFADPIEAKRRLRRDFKSDYEAWKIAFNI